SGIVSALAVPRERLDLEGGYLLAEVGSAKRHVRFGVLAPGGRTPHDAWGSDEDGRVLLARFTTGIPELVEARSLSSAELRVKPRGTAATLELNSVLEGPITSFGTRFWEHVRSVAPDLS